MRRTCVVCGDVVNIHITDDRGHYRNGHYFGQINIPIRGTGRYEKIGGSTLLGGIDIVKWTGKGKEVEYWECDRCYRED